MKSARFLSIIMCALLVFTLLPMTALAVSDPGTYTFDVSEGSITIGAGTDSGTLKVTYGASAAEIDNIPGTQMITITGSTTANTVTVASGVTANITLDNASIVLERINGGCAFNMTGATVNLYLVNTNILRSGDTNAGLLCPSGAVLEVNGQGSLSATGGQNPTDACGAGIGGSNFQSGGNITINRGIVTAVGGYHAAGIGSSGVSNTGTITINGGSVTAYGGVYTEGSASTGIGAGIGAGCGNGGTVNISGGTVEAYGGGKCGAGIGGGKGGNGGSVTITGGTVTATGGSNGLAGGGAGIGGGGNDAFDGGSGGDVTISGGTITAIGGDVNTYGGGAGIGGGGGKRLADGGNGGDVTISGGTVTAIGGDCDAAGGGAGIGGGGGVGGAGTLYIDGGSVKVTDGSNVNGTPAEPVRSSTITTPVYLTAVMLGSVLTETSVSSLTTNAGYPYGINDIKTDSAGKLYLYLPETTSTTAVRTALCQYSGSVATTTDSSTSLGTLSPDSAVPAVSTVTPNSSGSALSGNLTITFSEEMRTGAGTVSLDGGTTTLATGSWNADKTVYTIAYSGLSYSTSYTLTISGFEDYSGNVMTDDTSHGFTTVAAPYAGDPQNQPVISVSDGTATVTVNAIVYADGSLNASLTGAAIADALQKAAASAGDNGTVILEIVIDGSASASGMKLKLPASSLGSMMGVGADLLTLKTPLGTFSFNAETLAQIARQAPGNIEITVSAVEPSTLSDEARELVGTRPVYDFTVASENTIISDFAGGAVTVSLPYTPADGEDFNKIVIYYISDSGELIAVPNCIYDPETSAVTFTTTHFSVYAVGYNNIRFTDVSGWYAESVDFVTARSIMNGVGGSAFDPGGTMTRAMFVTVLYRMSGETGSYTNAFSDVPSGEWYENAVAWAYQKGITGGVGGNCFGPNLSITREQLAVMLYRYAQHVSYDVSAGEDTNILSYNDAFNISEYAFPALQWACGAAIIEGDNTGNLNPQSSATRAEAAAMLQRFIENVSSD